MRASDLKSMEMIGHDPKTGFPILGHYRIMAMGITGLGRLYKDLNQSLGADKMDVLLTRFGYDGGLAHATVISDLYRFDSPEELLKAGGVMRRLAGLAHETITEIDFNPDKKQLRFKGIWKESFEPDIFRSISTGSDTPVCAILAGLVSGYASAVIGADVLVKEISCKAQGFDHCTFEGRTLGEWGLDLADVRKEFKITDIKTEMESLKSNLEQASRFIADQEDEINALKQQIRPGSMDTMIFRSHAMATTMTLAQKVAPTAATVLIQGESGTGKEVLARFIHDQSGRKEEPFLPINCAALPSDLLESELFGHTKGAFTGAESARKGLFVQAGKGTLFLDEIGELPLSLQPKLLRAIQEKQVRPLGGSTLEPVKARILTATNQEIKEMVAEGTFREDLYFRISVFPITLPPLRNRREDILPLARHFLSRLSPDHPGFSPQAIQHLEGFSWSGNIRELENVVEYGVILAGDHQRILPEHFPNQEAQTGTHPMAIFGQSLPSCRELEQQYIRHVLNQTNGNKTEASRILGLSISTLWRRLNRS
ncbi:MAG: sigma 54-interacting transcriptional regulator [Desulfobacterium sp.]|nr:sigma 54-interacting transcriptional regulator [Desulfobacterium sp.]